jgi:hypothetical protein
MKKFLFLKTLRFLLPLTYAGIALLATSLLGVVLYLIIGNYYRGLEQSYLDGNAQGLAQSLSSLASREKILGNDNLKENVGLFKNQVNVAAFLMQSRVRILDSEGNVIADSGTPDKAWYIHLPNRDETLFPLRIISLIPAIKDSRSLSPQDIGRIPRDKILLPPVLMPAGTCLALCWSLKALKAGYVPGK